MKKNKLSLVSKIIVVFFMLFGLTITAQADNKKNNNVVCKEYGFDQETYTSKKTCFYPNTDLLTAYNLFRTRNLNNNDGKYLNNVIQENVNFQQEYESDNLLVKYNWLNIKNLMIILSFAGGETEIELKQKETGTAIIIVYSPD